MEDIISNIIVLMVITLVMGSLKLKVNKKRIEVNDVESGKRLEKEAKEGRLVIKFGRGIKSILIIGVIFFGIFFVIGTGTYIGFWDIFVGVDLGTVIVFGLILLFVFFTTFITIGWRIIVDKDNIYYRNYFFITKMYKFSELDKVVEKRTITLLLIRKEKGYFQLNLF